MQNISENTAKLVSIQGRGEVEAKYINVTFDEIFNPKPAEKEKSADDVIRKVKDKVNKINSKAGD